MISVLSAMPSQWALQYFCFSGAMQLQAGFAHFFVPVIHTSEAVRCAGPEAPQAWMILMQGAAEKDAGASAVGLRAMLGKIAESEMPGASVVARRDKLEGRSHVV